MDSDMLVILKVRSFFFEILDFFLKKKYSLIKTGGVAQGYGRYTLSNSEYVVYGEFASGSLFDFYLIEKKSNFLFSFFVAKDC